MEHIPIRKVIWDALETVIEAQMGRLARDIADTLGVSDAPLLADLKSKKISAYLYDEPADQEFDLSEMKCQDLVRLTPTSPFLTRCCAPVLWPNSGAAQHKCLAHHLQPSTLTAAPNLPVLEAIQVDGETYYVGEEGGPVYSATGEVKGQYTEETNTVELYEVG